MELAALAAEYLLELELGAEPTVQAHQRLTKILREIRSRNDGLAPHRHRCACEECSQELTAFWEDVFEEGPFDPIEG